MSNIDDSVINVSDIMTSFNVSQDDLNNIKSILDNIPDFSNNMYNIQYFIVLSSLINIITNNIDGSIVELGCNCGGTTIRISKILDLYNSKKSFHVYDTFTGFPQIDINKDNITINEDNITINENNMICSVSKFSHIMEQINIGRMPVIHQGLFSEINEDEYPNIISLAFFDSRLYNSIFDSFKFIWDKLSYDGIIVINSYESDDFPGVKKACIDYFQIINTSNNYTYNILYSNYKQIVIQKLKISDNYKQIVIQKHKLSDNNTTDNIDNTDNNTDTIINTNKIIDI